MSKAHEGTREKIAAVRSVASKLHAAEDAIDMAIIKLSELNLELPVARMNANLSAMVAQPAFNLVSEALRTLVQCRQQTIDAHAALSETQYDLGLGAMAMGEAWKIFKNEAQSPLTLVSAEAA